ncbi:MAG: acylphosphatase [Verrucomicrobia bacterium]|nr:acylphosphatase [Verrucomicrobiota bacterium]
MERQRVHVLYSGLVQGVGFRYTVKTAAQGYEAAGWVRNLPDGRVELTAEGERSELEAFLQAIRDSGLGSLIQNEEIEWSPARGDVAGFEIRR